MVDQHRQSGYLRLLTTWPLAIVLAGSGCTIAADDTGQTTMTIRRPGTLPSILPPREPTSQEPLLPPPSGTFNGVGQLISSPHSGCRMRIPIRNLVVTGDRVRYQSFRGTIQPDMSLQMRSGSGYLFGYFDGGRFFGNFWRPPPACNYALNLDHAG